MTVDYNHQTSDLIPLRIMKKNVPLVTFLFLLLFLNLFNVVFPVRAETRMQQPTVMLPTVTGTPAGVMVVVNLDQPDPVNVRSGPGVLYDQVGVLLPGQKAPALGRSAGGEWILIQYPGVSGSKGWVYAPVVSLTPGDLQIIEPPPTPTVAMTQTIDPTLAAQFIQTPIPTRMATYTPSAPLTLPNYPDNSVSSSGPIPMGLIILIILLIGMTISLFTLFHGR
jgi:hypothetical protein